MLKPILFFILFFTNCTFLQAEPPNILQIVWANDLGIHERSSLFMQIRQPLKQGLEVRYVNQAGQQRIVKTCDEYFTVVKSDGWNVINEANLEKESIFLHQCEVYKFLMVAKPAKVSYLRNFNLNKDYGLLPTNIIFPNVNSTQPLSTTFHDLIVKNLAFNKIEIKSNQIGGSATVSISAWGDLNGDGFDDMLIFVDYTDRAGHHAYDNHMVTKKSANDAYGWRPVDKHEHH